MYYVFERNDGYVGAINDSEQVKVGEKPSRLHAYSGANGFVSFTILLQSDDWFECVALMQRKRGVIDAVIDLVSPTDPCEVERRVREEIDTRMQSVRRELLRVHKEAAEFHGTGHQTQTMLELAIIALNNAINANVKADHSKDGV
jgi:hypothetical protein